MRSRRAGAESVELCRIAQLARTARPCEPTGRVRCTIAPDARALAARGRNSVGAARRARRLQEGRRGLRCRHGRGGDARLGTARRLHDGDVPDAVRIDLLPARFDLRRAEPVVHRVLRPCVSGRLSSDVLRERVDLRPVAGGRPPLRRAEVGLASRTHVDRAPARRLDAIQRPRRRVSQAAKARDRVRHQLAVRGGGEGRQGAKMRRR